MEWVKFRPVVHIKPKQTPRRLESVGQGAQKYRITHYFWFFCTEFPSAERNQVSGTTISNCVNNICKAPGPQLVIYTNGEDLK
jgi:hypothetical protein